MQATNIHSRAARRRSCLALAAALLFASGWAQAFVFNILCVSTAQELQDALDQASDGGIHNGETNFVRIVTGTYKTTDTTGSLAFHYLSTNATGGLDVSGGWAVGCATSTLNAALTVIDGNHATQVLTLGSTTSYIDVEYLIIQNGETYKGGAGLAINTGTGQNGPSSVSDTIIRNNHTSNLGGGIYLRSGDAGYLTNFSNNLITGNSGDLDGGAGFVDSAGPAQIYQNTVFGNTTPAAGGTGGLGCSGAGSFYINNNIFRNNTNYGLYLNANAGLHYNDYGTLGGIAPTQNVGALMVSPQFVNAPGGDFHLAGNSPLLGIAPPLDTYDLEGHRSPASGKMDLGAYEETIFIDGFDGG